MPTWQESEKEFARSSRDLIDRTALGHSRVAAFGGGTIGSRVVDLLERAGVGNLTVCDFDDVSIANIPRTIYSMADLDRPKAEVLAEHAAKINPLGRAIALHGDLLAASDETLLRLAMMHDVAVVAPDNMELHRRLNRLLHPLIPCVFTYVTDAGNAGEVILTTPHERGCIECLSNAAERAAAGDAGDFQAPGVDTLRVAMEATCAVLGLLLRDRKGGELYAEYVDPAFQLLLVFSRRRGPLAEALPSEVISATVRVDTRAARRDCPVCGTSRR